MKIQKNYMIYIQNRNFKSEIDLDCSDMCSYYFRVSSSKALDSVLFSIIYINKHNNKIIRYKNNFYVNELYK
jgi:hypothetical protein